MALPATPGNFEPIPTVTQEGGFPHRASLVDMAGVDSLRSNDTTSSGVTDYYTPQVGEEDAEMRRSTESLYDFTDQKVGCFHGPYFKALAITTHLVEAAASLLGFLLFLHQGGESLIMVSMGLEVTPVSLQMC